MTSKLDQDFPQLRKGPAAGEKKPLREKVITYYDLLFQVGLLIMKINIHSCKHVDRAGGGGAL